MCSYGKLICLFAALFACSLVVDAKPVRLSRRHPRHALHAKAPSAVPSPAEQNMFDAPLNQMDAGGSEAGSSTSGESSQEGDVSAEGADGADYTADNPEPMGNSNNHKSSGGQLHIFGSPNSENPGMEPLQKASTSSSSVGIAFAVLALIGAAVGVSIYVIKRNRLSIPFIKMSN